MTLDPNTAQVQAGASFASSFGPGRGLMKTVSVWLRVSSFF